MKKYNLAKAIEISPAAMTDDASSEKIERDTTALMTGTDENYNNQVEDLVSTDLKQAAEKEMFPEEEELSENQREVLMEEKEQQEQLATTSIMNMNGHDEEDARSSEKVEDDNQMEHEHIVAEAITEPSPVDEVLRAEGSGCCSRETADMAVDDLIESTMKDLNEQRRREEALLVSQQEEAGKKEEVMAAPTTMGKKKDMPMNGTTYDTPPKTENKEPKNQSTTVDPVDQQRSTCDCAVM